MKDENASSPIEYSLLDFQNEDTGPLFELFDAVYDSSQPLKKRWEWQYLSHPRVDEVQILVAKDNGKIIGCTSHFPMDLVLDGKHQVGYYGSGSMIHPDYRRRGIMEKIVAKRAELLPLYYGRGVMPNMFKLLLKFGYRQVHPSNYMVCIVSLWKWLLRKARLSQVVGTLSKNVAMTIPGWKLPDRFGEEFDQFWKDVAPEYPGIVVKDSAYMNWRYVDHPRGDYLPVYQHRDGQLVSVMVLRAAGHVARVVDFIYDPRFPSEPAESIASVKRYVKRCGFTNLYLWGTLNGLRDALKEQGFMELSEPHLVGVYTDAKLMDRAADVGRIHFVDGDGDFEFLE